MAEFAYNASALGAGGVIHRDNVTTVIPSLASVALAPTGGQGQAEANYKSPELSFDYALTRVFGAMTGDNQYTTSTLVVIHGLAVFGRLTVNSMTASVTSTRNLTPDDDHALKVTVAYDGIAVDGQPVTIEEDDDVRNCLRYADFRELAMQQPTGDELVTRLGAESNGDKQLFAQQLTHGRAVQASVVKSLRCAGGSAKGHVLTVPGLGAVRFGELMFKPGRRRLNLLRIQFDAGLPWVIPMPGSTTTVMQRSTFNTNEGVTKPGDGGSMTIASVEGNGSLLVP